MIKWRVEVEDEDGLVCMYHSPKDMFALLQGLVWAIQAGAKKVTVSIVLYEEASDD